MNLTPGEAIPPEGEPMNLDDKVTEHFTWREVIFSETATRKGIDNSLPEELINKARQVPRKAISTKLVRKEFYYYQVRHTHRTIHWLCDEVDRLNRKVGIQHHVITQIFQLERRKKHRIRKVA